MRVTVLSDEEQVGRTTCPGCGSMIEALPRSAMYRMTPPNTDLLFPEPSAWDGVLMVAWSMFGLVGVVATVWWLWGFLS